MVNHVKPTKEQLKANMDASLKDLDKLPKDPAVTPEVVPEVVEPVIVPDPPQDPPNPPEVTPEVVVEPQKDPEKDKSKEPDYKEKFSASSREAQLQTYKNKEIQKAMDDAEKITEVKEDEVKVQYPEWETMSDNEKKMATDLVIEKKRRDLVKEATNKFKKVDQWNSKVNTFVSDPTVLINHPELEGKSEEFKNFASEEVRRDSDLETLVLAFSGEQAKKTTPPKKGEMFPTGQSRSATPPTPKSDKISLAQAEILRKIDFKKYKELLIARKIDDK